jgi:hypothetical protein
MEVVLKAYLFTAISLNCALIVTKSIALANNIIKGSKIANQFIIWKRQRSIYNEEAEVLGRRWWSLFKKHNPDVVIRAGQKFKKNWFAHCTYSAFFKMYNQIEVVLVILDNAQKFDTPAHMDAGGNDVDNKSQAFGYLFIDTTMSS